MVIGFSGGHVIGKANSGSTAALTDATLCQAQRNYSRHLSFVLWSVRAVYLGPLVWRTGWLLEDYLNVTARPGVRPRAAREAALWSRYLEAEHNMLRTFAPEASAFVVETAQLIRGRTAASTDNLHIDGGLLRMRHAEAEPRTQVVSNLLATALLNMVSLADANHRVGGQPVPNQTASIRETRPGRLGCFDI